MARKKPETVVEKIIKGVDKVLHPQDDFGAPPEEIPQENYSEGAQDIPFEKDLPVSESQMSKHKKFDKFN